MNLSVIQRAALCSFKALALPKGATVLDAPCGDGSLAATLRHAGYDAHGVDINSTGQGLLGPRITTATLNVRLPFPGRIIRCGVVH
jgi:cyclopropane fatty-acyl-phospholipid synthase-like methyltransferase